MVLPFANAPARPGGVIPWLAGCRRAELCDCAEAEKALVKPDCPLSKLTNHSNSGIHSHVSEVRLRILAPDSRHSEGRGSFGPRNLLYITLVAKHKQIPRCARNDDQRSRSR